MGNCQNDAANLVLPGDVESVLGQELELVEGQRRQVRWMD